MIITTSVRNELKKFLSNKIFNKFYPHNKVIYEIAEEFGIKIEEDDFDGYGYYIHRQKKIQIDEKYIGNDKVDFFFHEFSHFLQFSLFGNEEIDYRRNNFLFSQILGLEQEACLMNFHLNKWFGFYDKHCLIYYKDDSFFFLKKYTKNYAEYDI